jgi:hypothetical protein
MSVASAIVPFSLVPQLLQNFDFGLIICSQKGHEEALMWSRDNTSAKSWTGMQVPKKRRIFWSLDIIILLPLYFKTNGPICQ